MGKVNSPSIMKQPFAALVSYEIQNIKRASQSLPSSSEVITISIIQDF